MAITNRNLKKDADRLKKKMAAFFVVVQSRPRGDGEQRVFFCRILCSNDVKGQLGTVWYTVFSAQRLSNPGTARPLCSVGH